MRSRARRTTAAAALVSALSFSAGARAAEPAHASSGRVALVRPTDADATMADALNRIRGELTAEGFDVIDVDAPPAAAETSASEDPPLATIELSVDASTHFAELRVFDRLTDKIVLRRAPVDDGDGAHLAELLAVRAVELLRASLLELLLEAHPPVPARAEADARQASKWASRGMPAPQRERPATWGVEAGVCVLGDVAGIPPAVLGLARLRHAFIGPIEARLTVAGLGTRPRVDAAVGSATVTRDLALLEIVAAPWRRWVVSPVASVGAGTMHASVDGQGTPPYAGRQSELWSVAVDGGVGAEATLGPRFSLSAEVHAVFAQPYPAVEFVGSDVARGGRPSLLGSVSVVGWL